MGLLSLSVLIWVMWLEFLNCSAEKVFLLNLKRGAKVMVAYKLSDGVKIGSMGVLVSVKMRCWRWKRQVDIFGVFEEAGNVKVWSYRKVGWDKDTVSPCFVLYASTKSDLPTLTVWPGESRLHVSSHGLTSQNLTVFPLDMYIFHAVKRLTFVLTCAFSCHFRSIWTVFLSFSVFGSTILTSESMGRASFTSFWCVVCSVVAF